MDLRDFLNRYTDDVYHARRAEAARRFIADPCLRHESGELLSLSLEDNVKRISSFLAQYPAAQEQFRGLGVNVPVRVHDQIMHAAYVLSIGVEHIHADHLGKI